MVTVVISYQPGTAEMLEVCLESIKRHTLTPGVKLLVITTKSDAELEDLCLIYDAAVKEVSVAAEPFSRLHGRMLDAVIPDEIDTEYVLTLDSDCFPVADSWLTDLLAMMGKSKLAGILHPFGPVPDGLAKVKLLWRVWSQHNWGNTHVACQLIRVADHKELKDCGVSYAGGDDTGLLVPMRANEKGWHIDGYKPTRCPKVEVLPNHSLDPEFNRLNCLIFGDRMCHVGAYSRGKGGEERPDSEHFEWALKRIIDEKGAEFLLEDRLSYRYRFDREKEVAQHKLNKMLGVSDDGRNIG